MVFATLNNLYEAVVLCMWSFSNVVGSFENSFASWAMGHIEIKNVVYSLCDVICPSVHNIVGWGAQKKTHNYFSHFNFQIH